MEGDVVESYKHLFAKQTLARWLEINQPSLVEIWDYSDVFVEYPFCLDAEGDLHGKTLWCETGLENAILENGVPSYQQCIDAKLLPICIFDVAVQREGSIIYAFEIVHKHSLTAEKEAYIDRIAQETDLRGVYGLSADWVLSQVKRPRRLKTLWQTTWG
jgi:hypothetical protein